jgi:undecaprenyl-diphosphatase
MKYHLRIMLFAIFSFILILASSLLDEFVALNAHLPILPVIIMSEPFILGAIAITVLAVLFKKKGMRFTVLSGLLISSVLLATQVTKLLFERVRPTDYTFDFSFPSGHSSFSFALVPLAFTHSAKAGYIMLAAAVLVASSRILLKEHYLSDVVAGSIMGYSISWIYITLIARDDANEQKK